MINLHKALKVCLLLILLIMMWITQAFGGYKVDTSISEKGYELYRVINDMDRAIYCELISENGYNEFIVKRFSYSRWYLAPAGYYSVRCL